MTSESKHTPGPWEAEHKNIHVGSVAICHGDGQGWWEVWTPNWGNGINQESNARLIAAAPDLLEALELIVHNDDFAGQLSTPERDKADAAIAKAKGEVK